MKIDQVAVTLFTVRDYCTSAKDIARTLERVKAIGYPAVQVSGVGMTDYDHLHEMITDAGLTCCATHEKSDTILEDTPGAIARLDALHTRYTAFPHPGNRDISSRASILGLARSLDKAGEHFTAAGKILTYHKHSNEFFRVDNATVLEILYNETNPAHLQAELDTYWIQHGGGNPVAWCRKMAQRLPLLHLKDYAITRDRVPQFAEIGRGNLDWHAICDAAAAAGCQWYIVEQDRNWHGDDPFESLKISFEYITQNLLDS